MHVQWAYITVPVISAATHGFNRVSGNCMTMLNTGTEYGDLFRRLLSTATSDILDQHFAYPTVDKVLIALHTLVSLQFVLSVRVRSVDKVVAINIWILYLGL